MSFKARLLAFLLLAPSLTNYAMAQCGLNAVIGGQMPDADGAVLASTAWDPDGSGPLPAVVVFGGAFDQLGNVITKGVAAYNPTTGDCSALATGLGGGQINALLVTSSNELIAAGSFGSIGGLAASNIARWNGVLWQPLGVGVGFAVDALVELPNGDIAVGGFAGNNAPVWRWNGTSWSSIGSNLTGRVSALAVLANGDILAGGNVLLPGSVSIASWNGVTWSTFAGNVTVPSPFGASVRVVQVLGNGDVIAAGSMTSAGGVAAPGIAKWDGVAWSALGGGVSGTVYSVVHEPNGDIVVGGLFDMVGGIPAKRVARWDGATWHALGAGLGEDIAISSSPTPVRTLHRLSAGDILAGGYFNSAEGDFNYVARWDGAEWGQVRAGTGGAVLATLELTNGDMVVAGEFTRVEGVAANRVARRVNGVWQPLGTGADAAVAAILELPNGDLIVGGEFTSIGGVSANHVARWDGSAWHSLGFGLPDAVHDLEVDAGGQILAAGRFLDLIAVWDGQTWHGTGLVAIPIGWANRGVFQKLPDGEILATAYSYQPVFGIRRWTGFGWQSVIAGIGAGPFAVHRDGSVTVSNGQYVRHWDGSSWIPLGSVFNGRVNGVLALPNGDVLAGGDFTTNGAAVVPGLARWNGVAWSSVGTGTTGPVDGLRWRPAGTVSVFGSFTSLHGNATAGFAELAPTCQAIATSYGAGCTGSGGLNVLAATTLPWLDSTYESVASGMAGNSVAVHVLGLAATSQTIASILPQGVAGCLLLATPDLLDFGVPVAGELELELAIPFSAGLLGATFRQQVVPLELGPSGAILAVTSSNALELTVGLF